MTSGRCVAAASPLKAHRLRVEHLDCALGIDLARPRLSWQLPIGSRRQVAYRLRADNGWDTGRVDCADSVLVGYTGPALRSGQRVHWQVKIWTDAGEGNWSEPSWFEMGLLDPADWQADWITPTDPLLRFEFELDRPVVSARLYATAQGLYEPFLNGARVGTPS